MATQTIEERAARLNGEDARRELDEGMQRLATQLQDDEARAKWKGPVAPDVIKALGRAQALVAGAEKDRTNQFHGYNYASAESLIAAGREALKQGQCVLAMTHTSWTPRLDVSDAALDVTVELLVGCATTGASSSYTVTYPGQVERGRPHDKAAAAAVTLALSYALRNLLLIPRVAEGDDVSARDDTAFRDEGQPQQAAPRGKRGGGGKGQPQQAAPKTPSRAAQRLAEQLDARGRTHDELVAAMQQRVDDTWKADEVKLIEGPVERWTKHVAELAAEVLKSDGWQALEAPAAAPQANPSVETHTWLSEALRCVSAGKAGKTPTDWRYWADALISKATERGIKEKWELSGFDVATNVVAKYPRRELLKPTASNAPEAKRAACCMEWQRVAETFEKECTLPDGEWAPAI